MSTLLSFERDENTPLKEELRKYLHTLGVPQVCSDWSGVTQSSDAIGSRKTEQQTT